MQKLLKVLAVCLIFILCFSVASCGEAGDIGMDGEQSGGDSSIVNNALNRKIVYTVSMDVEAIDVASLKTRISEKNTALGGYIEDNIERYDDGKVTYVNITYRVPTEKLDEFVASIEGNGGVERKSVYTKDITTSYVNAQAKKNALVERKALLEQMLNDTTISATDRISIINEISETNTELQAIELAITGYDSDVNFSTVKITISEKTTFMDVFAPILIVVFAIAAVICTIFLIKYFKKHKKCSH